MTQPRLLGLRNLFVFCVLLANVGLYTAWVHLEQARGVIGLNPEARPWAYLIAILAAVLYHSRQLNRHVEKVRITRLFDAIGIASQLVLSLAISFTLVYFSLKDTVTSRSFLALHLLVALPFNILLVRFLPTWLSRAFFPARLSQKAYLVGNGPLPQALREYLNKCEMLGIRFTGYFSDKPIDGLALPLLGAINDLPAFIANHGQQPERILAFNDTFDAPIFSRLVDFCRRQGIRLQIYTRFANTFNDPVKVYNEGELTFLTFDDEPLENPLNTRLKRLIDLAIALPVVVFILPVLTLLVAGFQRLQSPGQILFTQPRFGRDRRSFKIYKFRSMHVPPPDKENEIKQATENDPRIFPFGAFMRKTSIDEFPQFINVLRGEMSIVGPRPHLIHHDAEFEQLYHAYRSRHFVKPGITGYAQILGFRGEVTDPHLIVQRVENDLFYISNWSLRLDIYIIIKTALHIFFPPRTAY